MVQANSNRTVLRSRTMRPEIRKVHGGEVYMSGPYVMRGGVSVRCVESEGRQYAPKVFCGHDALIYVMVVLPGWQIVKRARRYRVAVRRWNRAVILSRDMKEGVDG